MKSIRTFLLTRLVLGTAGLLGLAASIVFVIVTRSLESQFDQNLSDRVLGFASLFFQTENELSFEFSDELMPEYDREDEPAYFQVRFADGDWIEGSNTLHGEPLDVPVTATFEPVHWSAPLPDGRQGRFVAQLVEVHHVYPEEGPGRPQAAVLEVVIARGREPLAAAVRMVLANCIAFSLVLTALVGFLSWRSVDRGLEPAHRLAEVLRAIRADDLPARLEVGELPRELTQVVETTDALIHRVDAALKRERRTTADIAHELRTPISELLTVAEVALRSDVADEKARSLSTVRDVAWRMERLVSILLELARLEAGTERFTPRKFDLRNLVEDRLLRLRPIGLERSLSVYDKIAPGSTIEADPEVVRVVLGNLLDNAHDYCPVGGAVICRLEERDGSWRLVIENEAPALGREDLDKLTEPFWRGDAARSDRNRSGLGLALSRALAERAGLELELELEDGVLRAGLRPSATARARRAEPGATDPDDAASRASQSRTRREDAGRRPSANGHPKPWPPADRAG